MINADKIAPSWIQTHSGMAFDLSNPGPGMVCIEDIAHALAQINRYTGHAAWPYSVAQHSIMVAEIVAATRDPSTSFPGIELHALLHDSPEYVLNDWSSPLKALIRSGLGGPGAPVVDQISERVSEAIRRRFGLAPLTGAEHRLIKQADLIALATEKRDLFGPPPCDGWGDATGFTLPEPLEKWCEMWEWTFAKQRFLDAFDRFGGTR